jgi:hypothetical protein
MRKKLFPAIAKISLISIVLAMAMFQFSALPVQAGSLANIKDTLTRLKTKTDANHEIKFDLPAGIDFDAVGGEDMISVDFNDDFFSNNLFVTSNFTMTDGVTTYVIDSITQGNAPQIPSCAGAAGNDKVRVGVEFDTETFHFRACPGGGFTASGTSLTIEIISADPDGTFANPAASGSYLTAIAVRDEGVNSAHSGSFALGIVDDDQVIITATVDPTFTFALSSNTCALGTLTTANVKTCTYTSTVATNATSGYVATIRAESDGTNINLNNDANAGIWINNVADFNITAGSEEYGFAIKSIGFGLPPSFDSDDGGCNNDAGEPGQALTASPVTYAGTAGPTAGHVETICHIAGISATSEAGTYTQVVTLIATGRF